MPFLFMAFLAFACLYPTKGLVESPAVSAALTWATTAAVALAAYVVARRVRRGLERDPTSRAGLLPWFERWRFLYQLVMLGAYGVALYAFGWGGAVGQFWQADG